MGVNAEPATENGSSYVFTDNYDLPPECM